MMKMTRRKKMKRFEIVVALALVVAVSGCGKMRRKALKNERAESNYQTAMADFSAGRIKEASSGFKKAILANPGNASARFQLACIQQDIEKNYFDALCNYREYMTLDPEGEKVQLARERMEICKNFYIKALVESKGVVGSEKLVEENKNARAKLEEFERKITSVTKENEKLAKRLRSLETENANLRRMVSKVDATLDETEKAKVVAVPEEVAVSKDDANDRISIPSDVLAVISDSSENEDKPYFATNKPPVVAAKPKDKKEDKKAEVPPRPKYYVVKDGDTLYKIAIKFYGRVTAWTEIREANKAVVSMDGRIKTGQKLTLP
jgi:LysM repeat protein